MSETQFRRYTKLPYLLDMINKGRLELRNPANWQDKNDSNFLKLYKIKKGLEAVLVLCFAEAPETYMHWKIYAGDMDGVCIGFDKERLLGSIRTDINFVHDYVAYRTIKRMRDRKPAIDDLPFVKRYAYFGEQEYRIIYRSSETKTQSMYIAISSANINFIDINPWVTKVESESMILRLRQIKGLENINLRQSTIIDNSGWKQIGKNAIDGKRQHRRHSLSSEYEKAGF